MRPWRIIALACEREQYPSFDNARASPTFRSPLPFTDAMLNEVNAFLHAS
jgi:hypothetical protein